MSESTQIKLDRVRKPRVHIKYEVETEDGVAQKELPFVVGVMGDFSKDNLEAKKPLRERKFVEIDRDNFDQVMSKMEPKVKLRVKNRLRNDDTEIPVELTFRSMNDFSPEKMVEQIPVLQKLMTIRNMLRDLQTRTDRSQELEALLEEALKNPAVLEKLTKQLAHGEKQ